jgi:hypothetical protein
MYTLDFACELCYGCHIIKAISLLKNWVEVLEKIVERMYHCARRTFWVARPGAVR